MLPSNNFPFEVRVIEETENQEILKNFEGEKFSFIRIGPKNYFLPGNYMRDAANIFNMPLRSDDIFVVTFPRSGTTWTQELVWILANDFDYSKAASIPLQLRYIFLEFSMFINTDVKEKIKQENVGKEAELEVLDFACSLGSEAAAGTPSPRFIKTHLPLSLLPPKLLDSTKVVYVARDPRDVAVSFFHLNKLFKAINYIGDFKSFWGLFVRNSVNWSPFFEHLKEAWQKRHHPNLLFLFYEDLNKDLPATVQRVADFLGKQLTAEQRDRLCTHLDFENFKNNSSVNNDEFKNLGMLASNEAFVRKGKSGSWRDYFDEDMTQEAEAWIAKNLQETDMRFPSMK